jgi:hypothetical protein
MNSYRWMAPFLIALLAGCGSDATNPTESSNVRPDFLQLDPATGLVASVTAPVLDGSTIPFANVPGTSSYLEMTEISRKQWLATGNTATWPADTLPIGTAATWISRDDALRVAATYTSKSGFTLRLPQEVELNVFLPDTSTRAKAMANAAIFDSTQGRVPSIIAFSAVMQVSGVYGGVREHLDGGGVFGPSYLDSYYTIPANRTYDTIAHDTRHPANGLRLVIVYH